MKRRHKRSPDTALETYASTITDTDYWRPGETWIRVREWCQENNEWLSTNPPTIDEAPDIDTLFGRYPNGAKIELAFQETGEDGPETLKTLRLTIPGKSHDDDWIDSDGWLRQELKELRKNNREMQREVENQKNQTLQMVLEWSKEREQLQREKVSENENIFFTMQQQQQQQTNAFIEHMQNGSGDDSMIALLMQQQQQQQNMFLTLLSNAQNQQTEMIKSLNTKTESTTEKLLMEMLQEMREKKDGLGSALSAFKSLKKLEDEISEGKPPPTQQSSGLMEQALSLAGNLIKARNEESREMPQSHLREPLTHPPSYAPKMIENTQPVQPNAQAEGIDELGQLMNQAADLAIEHVIEGKSANDYCSILSGNQKELLKPLPIESINQFILEKTDNALVTAKMPYFVSEVISELRSES